jgi:hypothetical protein
MMGEIVNLRTARKRARRRQDKSGANAQRVAHGIPKALRQEHKARHEKSVRDLDAHRLDKDEP